MSQVNLNPTYGALFIGVLISSVLFGVTMLQTLVYFQQYPSDRAWRKLAVSWLWFLDALHLALSAHFVYHYLVSNNANSDALSQIVWSFKLRIVVDSLVVSSVHTSVYFSATIKASCLRGWLLMPHSFSLYTSRLWTLLAIDDRVEPFGKEARRWSKQKMPVHASATRWIMRRVMPWFVSVLVVIGYAIVAVMCYETIRLDSFDDLAQSPCANYVPLASSIIIDAVIAGTLCYFLARCRPRSAAMNGPIKALMVYTMNTGVITSVCSLITMVMMAAFPKTFIPIAIDSFFPPSVLVRNPVRLGDPLDQKHPPFGSFPAFSASASASSIQLIHITQPTPNPANTLSTTSLPLPQNALCPPGSDMYPGSGATGMGETTEWTRTSPPQTLRVPRLSHPDVCTHEGIVETVVGVGVSVAFPTHTHPISLGSLQRMHSFADSGASSATAVTTTLPLPTAHVSSRHHPLAATASLYDNPIDPLTPISTLTSGCIRASPTHPLASGMDVHTGVEGVADPNSNANSNAKLGMYRDRDSLGAPSFPGDRALSPLRFASYSSSTPSCSFSFSPSMPGTPTSPRTPVTPVTPNILNTPSKDRDARIPIRSLGSLTEIHTHPQEPSRMQPQSQPQTSAQTQTQGRRSPSPIPLLPPRPSRPRLPSAYSTTSSEMDRDAETRRSVSAGVVPYASGQRGSIYGSGSSTGRDRDRYTRMVCAARESRRGLRLVDLQSAEREKEREKEREREKAEELERVLGREGAREGEGEEGGEQPGRLGCMEDERGVWVWGGPGASLS
ncbi:hypothetical protein GY45DRAFT_498879 [Cubamyces sp. BRFM 1775]|nr:hypothetical protein GY45DRAFT_498879 [Cubamyces sp. BRFM 1775]